MITMLLLLFGIIGNWLLGVAVVVLLSQKFKDMNAVGLPVLSPAEAWGLGFAFGIALNSWILFVGSFCRVPLTGPFSLGIALSGWILFFALRSWRGYEKLQTSSTPVARTCQGLLCLLFLNLLIQTLLTPQRLWDERAIYGIKAAVLFEDHSIDSPPLASPEFVQYHPRYPLLIPLAELNLYSLMGEVDDRLAKVIFPLMFLGLVLCFAGVLSRQLGGDRGWIFATLLATIPCLTFWDYGFLSGQGDAPIACYHGLAVLYIWDWLRHAQQSGYFQGRGSLPAPFSLVMGGLLTGFTLFVKDEGIAFFIVNATVLGIVLLIGQPRTIGIRILHGLIFIGCCALVIGPWLWHRQGLPKTGEMTYFDRLSRESLQSGLFRLRWSLQHLFSRMFLEAFTWGLQWWGVAVAILLNPYSVLNRAQLYLLLDLLGAITALIVAALIAPTTVEEHLGWSSHRFLMQLTPVAILFMAGQWDALLPNQNRPRFVESRE